MEQKVEGFVWRIFETHLGEENPVEMLRKVLDVTEMVGRLLFHIIQNGGRIVWCESGGNASGAGHLAEAIAEEFRHKFGVDSSLALTANGADDADVAREVQKRLTPKDVLVAISTFGNDENILHALNAARSLGAKTVGLLGFNGGRAITTPDLCSLAIIVPEEETEQIEQAHLLLGRRILCDIIGEHLSREEF